MNIRSDYQRSYLARRRQKAREFLGECCAACGETETLEFDHIDPSTKEYEIANGIAKHVRWDLLVLELQKCQLLCKRCHADKSRMERRQSVTHGKYHAAYHLGCICSDCLDFKATYGKLRNRNRRTGE